MIRFAVLFLSSLSMSHLFHFQKEHFSICAIYSLQSPIMLVCNAGIHSLVPLTAVIRDSGRQPFIYFISRFVDDAALPRKIGPPKSKVGDSFSFCATPRVSIPSERQRDLQSSFHATRMLCCLLGRSRRVLLALKDALSVKRLVPHQTSQHELLGYRKHIISRFISVSL